MRARSAGEQRRFVAAGAGADLEEGVARVVGVARQQRGLQLASAGARCRPRRVGDLLLRHLSHRPGRRACSRARRARSRSRCSIAAEAARPARSTSACSRRQLAEALHVAGDRRVGERGVELGEAQREALELLTEGGFHAGRRRGAGRPARTSGRRSGARRRRRASLTLVVGRAARRCRAGTARDTVCASCARCSPSAACSSASVPCSIFCVRPRDSASSTASTSSPLGEQLARAGDLGGAPVVGLGVAAPGSAAPCRAGPASARSSARRSR